MAKEGKHNHFKPAVGRKPRSECKPTMAITTSVSEPPDSLATTNAPSRSQAYTKRPKSQTPTETQPAVKKQKVRTIFSCSQSTTSVSAPEISTQKSMKSCKSESNSESHVFERPKSHTPVVILFRKGQPLPCSCYVKKTAVRTSSRSSRYNKPSSTGPCKFYNLRSKTTFRRVNARSCALKKKLLPKRRITCIREKSQFTRQSSWIRKPSFRGPTTLKKGSNRKQTCTKRKIQCGARKTISLRNSLKKKGSVRRPMAKDKKRPCSAQRKPLVKRSPGRPHMMCGMNQKFVGKSSIPRRSPVQKRKSLLPSPGRAHMHNMALRSSSNKKAA